MALLAQFWWSIDMQYVLIENGVVTNAIVCSDATFAASIGYVAGDVPVAIGWSYDGTNFTAPLAPSAPPAPPLTATPYQFKAALVQQNLYTQALAAVNAGPLLTQLAWADALVFSETDPLITSMATTLGQTTDQVHTLFQLAATLSP